LSRVAALLVSLAVAWAPSQAAFAHPCPMRAAAEAPRGDCCCPPHQTADVAELSCCPPPSAIHHEAGQQIRAESPPSAPAAVLALRPRLLAAEPGAVRLAREHPADRVPIGPPLPLRI
jgi:hypothetical protein